MNSRHSRPAHRAATHPPRAARRRSILGASLAAAALLALACGAGSARAQTAEEDELHPVRHRGDLIQIFTGDVEIPAGTIRDGRVVCIGGHVTIRGQVTRDVIVILGGLEIDGGEVGQSAVGVLSKLELRDAEVGGDLVNILGGMNSDNVLVGRELFDLGFLGGWFPRILTVLTWLRMAGLLIVFVLLVLLVAIAPDRVRLIGQEAPVRYVSALFLGLLAYAVLAVFIFPLALVTVLGLPFVVLAYLVVKWLGLAGIFHALGQRVALAFGREVSPLGAVLLVFAAYVAILLALSPLGPLGLAAILLFHVWFFFFFEAPALGLILLTRVGTRAGPPPGPPAVWVPPPEPPAAPAPPVAGPAPGATAG